MENIFPIPAKEISFAGMGKFFFFPLFEIFFWPFLAFFAEKGREGLKHPFLVQKSGGKFFPGGVKKHELGVGNYRQRGRKAIFFFIFNFPLAPEPFLEIFFGTVTISFG